MNTYSYSEYLENSVNSRQSLDLSFGMSVYYPSVLCFCLLPPLKVKILSAFICSFRDVDIDRTNVYAPYVWVFTCVSPLSMPEMVYVVYMVPP